MLDWNFYGEGEWTAFSAQTNEDVELVWRIVVCDDGTFDVSESDSELTTRKETFDTLRDAKSWCQEREAELSKWEEVPAKAG